MNLSRIRSSALLALALFAFQIRTLGQIAYDSLGTPVVSALHIVEIGNTVTLSGNKRFVTSFSINVGAGSTHAGKMNDYILRFYLPSAPGDYPGKLIWQSRPKTNVEMINITFKIN